MIGNPQPNLRPNGNDCNKECPIYASRTDSAQRNYPQGVRITHSAPIHLHGSLPAYWSTVLPRKEGPKVD